MSHTDATVAAMIKGGESLTVEFKGEQKLRTDKKKVSDQEIYEAVVCLANTEGGTILIGVEDDGSITGAGPRHGDFTDTKKLAAAIFNNTVPPVSTTASLHTIYDKAVIAIKVEKSNSVCATTNGKCLRRSVAANGEPQCLPYYPHEHQRKAGQIGDFDYSACVLVDTHGLTPVALPPPDGGVVRAGTASIA